MTDLSLFDYTAQIICTHTRKPIIEDLDCTVCVDDIDTSGDDVVITIGEVWVNGENLFKGDKLSKLLAATIANAAESDDSLIERVMERNGIYTTARPGSDDAIEWKRD